MNADSAPSPATKTVRKKPKLKESVKMWGKPVIEAGFTIIPSTLLLKQDKLGLDAVDINILFHLMVAWWKKEKAPYLSKKTIAARMGVDPARYSGTSGRWRSLKSSNEASEGVQTRAARTNQYDLRLLADKLHPLAVAVKKERAAKKGGEE